DHYSYRHRLIAESLAAGAIDTLATRRIQKSIIRESMYMEALKRRPNWALAGLEALVEEKRLAKGEWHLDTLQARLNLAMARFHLDPRGEGASEVKQIEKDMFDKTPLVYSYKVASFVGLLAGALKAVGDHEAAAYQYYLAANLLIKVKVYSPHA